MVNITFNAFNFVREKLKSQKIPYHNVSLCLPDDFTPRKLQEQYNLTDRDVEFVFINGKVHPKETILQNGDRIAFVPPGTPGSYRLILGAKKRGED